MTTHADVRVALVLFFETPLHEVTFLVQQYKLLWTLCVLHYILSQLAGASS